MTPPSLLFAAAALVPAMTNPAEGAPRLTGAAALVVALCNGGTVAAPLGAGDSPPAAACCCAKGCREARRQRIDRKQ